MMGMMGMMGPMGPMGDSRDVMEMSPVELRHALAQSRGNLVFAQREAEARFGGAVERAEAVAAKATADVRAAEAEARVQVGLNSKGFVNCRGL